LSKQELLIDQSQFDDSQQSNMRFGGEPLREEPVTSHTFKTGQGSEKLKKKLTKTQKAEQDFFSTEAGSQETDPSMLNITSEFKWVMNAMTMRDHMKEIADAKQYVASRQTNTNEAIQKAKQGHFKLNKKRMIIPSEYLTTTNDTERLNLCMLNDYMNGYTEKLSRGNPKDASEIKLD
jgi:cellobiose-specific phosphotransferase system component IIA